MEDVLTEYAASSNQTLRNFFDITLDLFNLNYLCPLINSIPLQIQNIPASASALRQFVTSQMQAFSPGPPVYFPQWQQWITEFVSQLATRDIVSLFNSIHAL